MELTLLTALGLAAFWLGYQYARYSKPKQPPYPGHNKPPPTNIRSTTTLKVGTAEGKVYGRRTAMHWCGLHRRLLRWDEPTYSLRCPQEGCDAFISRARAHGPI